MLFFFHLFAGIVLGILIGDRYNDRRWILPFIIGSVLPDLIDKPTGYIFFADIFGTGRIFLHSIVIVGILILLGYLFWKSWAHPEVLAVALGMLLHQVLDLMIFAPEEWFFPLFGITASNRGSDYALTLVLKDFTTGSEWIFAGLIGLAILLFLVFRYKAAIPRYRNLLAGLLGAGAVLFIIIGGFTIGIVFSRPTRNMFGLFRFLGWSNPFEFIVGGLVFLLCALMLWRMRTHILENNTPGSTQP